MQTTTSNKTKLNPIYWPLTTYMAKKQTRSISTKTTHEGHEAVCYHSSVSQS